MLENIGDHRSEAPSADIQAGTPQPIDGEEYVRWAYRLLLGREPENTAVVKNHIHKNNRDLLLKSVFELEEFRTKYVRLLTVDTAGQLHPYMSWDREAVAFIHLGKTGGATFHSLLRACFSESCVCPERRGVLHLHPPAYLANYDLFSGHFDYFSTCFIPRRRVRCVSIFRDPFRRLISWYRFCRSHPITGEFEFSSNPAFRLANELEPEEFFEHPVIRSRPDANNMYLLNFGATVEDSITLGTIISTTDHPDSSSPVENGASTVDVLAREGAAKEALVRAVQRVLSLDGIGLTERFDELVELIFSTLGLPIPRSQAGVRLNVTDELPGSVAWLTPVPPVEVTPRLSRALEGLTRYDRVIYNAARREFERRLKQATR